MGRAGSSPGGSRRLSPFPAEAPGPWPRQALPRTRIAALPGCSALPAAAGPGLTSSPGPGGGGGGGLLCSSELLSATPAGPGPMRQVLDAVPPGEEPGGCVAGGCSDLDTWVCVERPQQDEERKGGGWPCAWLWRRGRPRPRLEGLRRGNGHPEACWGRVWPPGIPGEDSPNPSPRKERRPSCCSLREPMAQWPLL